MGRREKLLKSLNPCCQRAIGGICFLSGIHGTLAAHHKLWNIFQMYLFNFPRSINITDFQDYGYHWWLAAIFVAANFQIHFYKLFDSGISIYSLCIVRVRKMDADDKRNYHCGQHILSVLCRCQSQDKTGRNFKWPDRWVHIIPINTSEAVLPLKA